MKANELITTIKALFPLKRTLCVEGSPGGGKTTIVRDVAKELGVGYIELHLPTMLVEDFGVLYPKADSNKLEYKLPDWFPSEDRTDIPDEGILCFDDRNQASADIQKVLANVCQARTLHGAKLKDGWHVISTGNRQKDRAGANRVLSHLRNRETVVELETNLDEWVKWALMNDVKQSVVSFLQFRPNLLHDFDPQREQNPSPRSWVEGVSDIIGVIPNDIAEQQAIMGAVGEGAGAEFISFLDIQSNLPSPDRVFENPQTAPIPEETSHLYAYCGAVAYQADKNIDNLIKYCRRLSSDTVGKAEFSILTVKLAVNKFGTKLQGQEFAKWCVENAQYLN